MVFQVVDDFEFADLNAFDIVKIFAPPLKNQMSVRVNVSAVADGAWGCQVFNMKGAVYVNFSIFNVDVDLWKRAADAGRFCEDFIAFEP